MGAAPGIAGVFGLFSEGGIADRLPKAFPDGIVTQPKRELCVGRVEHLINGDD